MSIEKKSGILTYPVAGVMGERSETSTWLRVKPKKPLSINFSVRGAKGSVVDDDGTGENSYPPMYFLLPDQFSYGISHEWKEYSNIIGEAKAALANLTKSKEQLVGVSAAAIKGEVSKSTVSTSSIAVKNDNPMMYENSGRKEISFEFMLTAYSSAEQDVYYPINLLQYLSSPESTGDALQFEYPYIFDISVVYGLGGSSETMFYIRNACLKSVTPSFFAPYSLGYATKAQVTLTFGDLDPLYRTHSWNKKQTINVSTKGGQ